MSAQAEQLKTVVDNLAAIVSGSRGAAPAPEKAATRSRKAATAGAQPHAGATSKPVAASTAERTIPFEDSEAFGGF